jgi:hypothetical protein
MLAGVILCKIKKRKDVRQYFAFQKFILILTRGQKRISSAPPIANHIPAIGASFHTAPWIILPACKSDAGTGQASR